MSRLLGIQLRERDWYERQLRQVGSGAVPAGTIDPLTGLPGPQASAGTGDQAIWLREGTGGELQVALVEVDELASLDGLHGAGQSEHALRALAADLRAGRCREPARARRHGLRPADAGAAGAGRRAVPACR